MAKNHRSAVYVRTDSVDDEYRERVGRLIESLNRDNTMKADVFSVDGSGSVSAGLNWPSDGYDIVDADLISVAQDAGYVQAIVVNPTR